MYRAKTTFWAPDNRLIREGDVLPDGDDVIDGREELFDPVVVTQVDESRRGRRRSRGTKTETSTEPEAPATSKPTTSTATTSETTERAKPAGEEKAK